MGDHRSDDLPPSERLERLEGIVAQVVDAVAGLMDKLAEVEAALTARDEHVAGKIDEATARAHTVLEGLRLPEDQPVPADPAVAAPPAEWSAPPA